MKNATLVRTSIVLAIAAITVASAWGVMSKKMDP
jgi:hypothetical protein